MANISWGKCTIEYVALTAEGAIPENPTWNALPIPKENTTILNTTSGTKTEAKEEGGANVDVKRTTASYELEFELYVKKNDTDPFSSNDDNGTINGDFAVRVVPEDRTCKGILMEKTSLSREIKFSSADGITYRYIVSGLKPTTGNIVKLQVFQAQATS